MKKSVLLLFGGLLVIAAYTQTDYYPRDTTYTIASTFKKIQENYPDARPVWAVLPKEVKAYPNIVYSEPEANRNLYLDLFLPKYKRQEKLPAVLMIHGGGWMTGSKENLIPMAHKLAEKGYVTVTVEYRLGGECPYPAAVYDLKSAVKWLRANADEYGIDTSKIAAYGCSAGAQLATLLGTTNGLSAFEARNQNNTFSSNVQAIINIDGITSFIHPEAEPEWTGHSANAWLGNYSENYERWEEASPLEYAGRNTPPILFVNSSQARFHAGRDDLITILNQFGIYNELYTFEESTHGFWLLDPWFEPTLNYSVRFLKLVFN
jgi:pectinesterase